MKIAASTVLVTGANGGIGSAIAIELAARGASVVLSGRAAPDLERLCERLRASGMPAQSVACDLAQSGMPQQLVERTLALVPRIDVVVNCAGVQNFGPFSEESPKDTAQLFNVNTVAPIALVNAVLPHMLRNGRGHLVNVGSIFGSIGFPCFATYSASKFALRGFSEALRRELQGSGVAVSYVAPRFTRTALNGELVGRMADALHMNQDDPHEVANTIVDEIERDGRDRYLGWPEAFFVRVNALFPRLVDRSLTKQGHAMRRFAEQHAP
jgi:short-subunit dehydrogenase